MQNKRNQAMADQAIADHRWERNKIKKALKNQPAKKKTKNSSSNISKKQKDKKTGLVNEMRSKAWKKKNKWSFYKQLMKKNKKKGY